MKNYIKIGGIVFLIILAGVLITKYIKDIETFKDLKKAIKEKDQKVKILSDHELEMNDRIVSKGVSEILYKGKIDSLAKLLKIKPKTITQYVSVNSQIKADIGLNNDTLYNSETGNVDSISLNYEDQWITINGTVKKEGTPLHISGKDSLQLTYIRKGNNIIVNAKNTNKYIHLTGASSLTISEPKPDVVQIRPFIGVGYDPISKKVGPSIGVGITVDLGRLVKSVF